VLFSFPKFTLFAGVFSSRPSVSNEGSELLERPHAKYWLVKLNVPSFFFFTLEKGALPDPLGGSYYPLRELSGRLLTFAVTVVLFFPSSCSDGSCGELAKEVASFFFLSDVLGGFGPPFFPSSEDDPTLVVFFTPPSSLVTFSRILSFPRRLFLECT